MQDQVCACEDPGEIWHQWKFPLMSIGGMCDYVRKCLDTWNKDIGMKILTLPKETTGFKVWRNLNLLTGVHEVWEVIEGRKRSGDDQVERCL